MTMSKMHHCYKPMLFGPSGKHNKIGSRWQRNHRSPLHIARVRNSNFLEDRILSIKISLAKSSGKLDMGWLGLEEIPPGVFDLTSLEVQIITLSKSCEQALLYRF